MIPPAASRALERAIPGAQARYLPGEGPFLVLDRWPEICAWLTGE